MVGDFRVNAIETFLVHRDIMAQFSPYFFEEYVELRDDDPEDFEVFRQFAYTGRIFTVKDGDRMNLDDDDPERGRLSDCWELGIRLASPLFKDAIADAMIAKMLASGFHPTDLAQDVYASSPGLCGMRRLIVDIAAYKWEDRKSVV